MSEQAAKPAIQYHFTYPHGVDEKRRLQIPAKWRPEAENTQLTIVLWPQNSAGPCLRVLPPEEFAKKMAIIEAMPDHDPKKVVLKRFIGSESDTVTLDKAGRIVLPEAMARKAGIQDDAMLAGCLSHFEVWNPDRYEKAKAADAEAANEAFKYLG